VFLQQKNRRHVLSCVHEVFNSALTPHRQNTFASEEVEIDKLDISFAVKKTNEELFFISTVAATMVRCGEERDEK